MSTFLVLVIVDGLIVHGRTFHSLVQADNYYQSLDISGEKQLHQRLPGRFIQLMECRNVVTGRAS